MLSFEKKINKIVNNKKSTVLYKKKKQKTKIKNRKNYNYFYDISWFIFQKLINRKSQSKQS